MESRLTPDLNHMVIPSHEWAGKYSLYSERPWLSSKLGAPLLKRKRIMDIGAGTRKPHPQRVIVCVSA
jgi:hypothetical protein